MSFAAVFITYFFTRMTTSKTLKFILMLLFLAISEGFVTDRKTVAVEGTTQQPAIHNLSHQDYLQDDSDQKIEKPKKYGQLSASGSGAILFKDEKNDDGTYEFKAGGITCKFYLGSRQVTRSLQCNEKKCAIAEEKGATSKWNCDDQLSCTVYNSVRLHFFLPTFNFIPFFYFWGWDIHCDLRPIN